MNNRRREVQQWFSDKELKNMMLNHRSMIDEILQERRARAIQEAQLSAFFYISQLSYSIFNNT